jgi:hypothetical protein
MLILYLMASGKEVGANSAPHMDMGIIIHLGMVILRRRVGKRKLHFRDGFRYRTLRATVMLIEHLTAAFLGVTG